MRIHCNSTSLNNNLAYILNGEQKKTIIAKFWVNNVRVIISRDLILVVWKTRLYEPQILAASIEIESAVWGYFVIQGKQTNYARFTVV